MKHISQAQNKELSSSSLSPIKYMNAYLLIILSKILEESSKIFKTLYHELQDLQRINVISNINSSHHLSSHSALPSTTADAQIVFKIIKFYMKFHQKMRKLLSFLFCAIRNIWLEFHTQSA